MPLFKSNRQTPSNPASVAQTAVSAKLDTAAVNRLGQLLDLCLAGQIQTSVAELISITKATTAPSHFPQSSIWAIFARFLSTARVDGHHLTAIKVNQFCLFWHDDAFTQSSDILRFYLGRATDGQRGSIAEMAFACCLDLDLSTLVVPSNGDTVADILFTESIALDTEVDYLRWTAGLPTPQITAKERIDRVLALAPTGDPVAVLIQQSVAAASDEDSLGLLEQAARLGSVDAMLWAAEMAKNIGREGAERFWVMTAAEAGDAGAMLKAGFLEYLGEDQAAARIWFEKAGRAGESSAYGLLLRDARECGDEAQAVRWAAVGAVADDIDCLDAQALLLLEQDPAGHITRAHAMLTRAAILGHVRAMVQAGVLCQRASNLKQAKYWLTSAIERGDESAPALLDQWGLR